MFWPNATWGRKGIFQLQLLYPRLPWRNLRARTQTGTWSQELKQKPGRETTHWLTSSCLLSYFPYTGLGRAPPTVACASDMMSLWWRQLLNWSSLFPSDSSLSRWQKQSSTSQATVLCWDRCSQSYPGPQEVWRLQTGDTSVAWLSLVAIIQGHCFNGNTTWSACLKKKESSYFRSKNENVLDIRKVLSCYPWYDAWPLTLQGGRTGAHGALRDLTP